MAHVSISEFHNPNEPGNHYYIADLENVHISVPTGVKPGSMQIKNCHNITFDNLDLSGENRNNLKNPNASDQEVIKNAGAWMVEIFDSTHMEFQNLKMFGLYKADNLQVFSSQELMNLKRQWNRKAPSGLRIDSSSEHISINHLEMHDVQYASLLRGQHITIGTYFVKNFSRDGCSIQNNNIHVQELIANNFVDTVSYIDDHCDIVQLFQYDRAHAEQNYNLPILQNVSIGKLLFRQGETVLSASPDNGLIMTDSHFESIDIQGVDIDLNTKGNAIRVRSLGNSQITVNHLINHYTDLSPHHPLFTIKYDRDGNTISYEPVTYLN